MQYSHKVIIGVLSAAAVLYILMQQLTVDPPNRQLYNSWRSCLKSKIDQHRGNANALWLAITKAVTDCDQPYVDILKIEDQANEGEIKRHIWPLRKGERQTLVTLGVGHDTAAEEHLRTVSRLIPRTCIAYDHFQKAGNNETIEFFGADPIIEINREKYSKFGKFFPFAVSANPGFTAASVYDETEKKSEYTYMDKLVVNVDAVYFFKKLIGKTFIDSVWFDPEGAEFGLFSFINKGGNFDEHGIVICQMNFEVHDPSYTPKDGVDRDTKLVMFHDFVFQTLEDGRYAFFKAVFATHVRVYMVNLLDESCVQKYFPENIQDVKL